MNKPIFNREYWITQLINEVGLAGTPYEELDKHFVDSGSILLTSSPSPQSVVTAKQYVDNQLVVIEEAYNQFDDAEMIEFSPKPDFDQVGQRLQDVAESLNDDTFLDDYLSVKPTQLQLVPQVVEKTSIKAFNVTINENDFVVMMNVVRDDWKAQDQINHIVNTSFFVELRDPATITDSDRVISYYQFVNAIQPFLKPAHDLTAYEKINEHLNTVFDGIKLDGFDS